MVVMMMMMTMAISIAKAASTTSNSISVTIGKTTTTTACNTTMPSLEILYHYGPNHLGLLLATTTTRVTITATWTITTWTTTTWTTTNCTTTGTTHNCTTTWITITSMCDPPNNRLICNVCFVSLCATSTYYSFNHSFRLFLSCVVKFITVREGLVQGPYKYDG